MSSGHCLLCKKPVEHTFRPFCSKRCQQIDLGRWLKGYYVVSSESSDQNDLLLESSIDETKEY